MSSRSVLKVLPYKSKENIQQVSSRHNSLLSCKFDRLGGFLGEKGNRLCAQNSARRNVLIKLTSYNSRDMFLHTDLRRHNITSFDLTLCYDIHVDIIPPQAVKRIQYGGGRTNIASALIIAREQIFNYNRGDREFAPNFAVVFTDGNSNVREEDTIPEAIQNKLEGIHTIVISVGK